MQKPIKTQEGFKDFLKLGDDLQKELKRRLKKKKNGNQYYKRTLRRMVKAGMRR